MGKAPKAKAFYAVARKKQHTGSVYPSWKEAQPHTTGISGVQCRGCDTMSEVREHFKKHGIDMKDVTWAPGLEPQDLADSVQDLQPPALPVAPAAVPPPADPSHPPMPPPVPPIPVHLRVPVPPVAAQRAVSAPPRLLYTDSARIEPPTPSTAPPLPAALSDALRALSPAEIPAVLSELARGLAAREEADQTQVPPEARLATAFLHLRNLIDGELLALGDPDV